MTFPRRALLALLATAVLAACGGGGGSSSEIDVPFTSVTRGQASVPSTYREVVARGSSDLAAALGAITVDGNSLPPVDLSVVEVVGVVLGSRPNGCYGVTVTRVSRTGDRVLVRFHEDAPAATAICTANVVTPYHLVAIPRSDLPVAFNAE